MNKRRVFILDDEIEMLDLLKRILENTYEVHTSFSEQNLEREIDMFRPDVLIIDHFIGNARSQEIISKYSRDLKDVPVIIHSAHDDIEKIAEQSKATGYLKKPSSIKEIREKIESVIKIRP